MCVRFLVNCDFHLYFARLIRGLMFFICNSLVNLDIWDVCRVDNVLLAIGLAIAGSYFSDITLFTGFAFAYRSARLYLSISH